MYLLITEDGSVFKSKEISEDDRDSADDGYLDIIDISDPEIPLRYLDEGWTDIDDCDFPDPALQDNEKGERSE